MKTTLASLLGWLLLLLLLLGCGDEEGTPPLLGDLRYQSKAYQSGFNSGKAPLYGTVRFEDPDRDLAILHVRWRDCDAGPLQKVDFVEEDQRGLASATISFVSVVSTNCPVGEYAVKVSASDGQGLSSNVLTATYQIYR